jgi:hypothetical protein
MTTIDVFYQGEGVREIEHIEIDSQDTFGTLRNRLIEKHGLPIGTLLFLEDTDEPIAEAVIIVGHAGHAGVKAHVHRCHRIKVAVTFNNETVHHEFAPSATVGRVKQWAAVHKFHMSEAEAGEHVLQIAGTHERPAPGTHIGALAACPECKLHFSLVPDQRVNGYPLGVDR